VQDTNALNFGLQGRADWRALTNAALIGTVVGIGLGAGYLTAGLGHVALERAEAVRVALGPESGLVAASAELRGPQGLPANIDPDAAHMAAAAPTHARELDCLAQAVYFEARGESPRGQQAVATVVMNRVKNPNFPKTVCAVVYQGSTHHNGCQFSFACDGQAERVVEHTAWDRARAIAARTLSGFVLRDVGSATHFHTTGVDPEWGGKMLRVAQVGLHVFYRFNPHAPRAVQAEPDDDSVVFTSAPVAAPPAELRLAQALTTPEPAKPAVAEAPKPVEAAPAKAETPSPIAKTDAPISAKPQVATPS